MVVAPWVWKAAISKAEPKAARLVECIRAGRARAPVACAVATRCCQLHPLLETLFLTQPPNACHRECQIARRWIN